MILDNISRALKEQNWLAAAIEFVIVIFGVVIGFQINSWAEERAAAERAALMLERLHEEAEANVAYFVPVLTVYERENERRLEVIERFLADDLEGADRDAMIQAIALADLYPAAAPPRGIYDEIVNAGLVSSIGDDALRAALADYWSGVDWLRGQIRYSRQLYIGLSKHSDFDFSRLEYDPDSSRKRRHLIDLDAAARSEEFMQYLLLANNSSRAMTEWWRNTHARAKRLCEETGRLTGRPCDPDVELPEWAR